MNTLESRQLFEQKWNKIIEENKSEKSKEELKNIKFNNVEQRFLDILQKKDLIDIIIKEYSKFIVGEEKNIKTIFLITMGGILVNNARPTSTNICINSSSGAGKDALCSAILKPFIDYNYCIKRTRITPTVFTYWKQKETKEENWSWNKKIVYLEDVGESTLNSEVFKVMASGGSEATVVKDQRAVDIIINGKPVFVITTAEGEPNEELKRRFPLIYLDETKEQTENIIKRITEYASKGYEPVFDPFLKQSMFKLKPVNVIVPYSDKIGLFFCKNNYISLRTNIARVIDYIKFHAAIYQHQREIDSDGNVLANGEDWDGVLDSIKAINKSKSSMGLTHKQRKILALFQPQKPMRFQDVLRIQTEYFDKSGLNKALIFLKQAEYIRIDPVEENGKTINFYTLSPNLNDTEIPSFKELSVLSVPSVQVKRENLDGENEKSLSRPLDTKDTQDTNILNSDFSWKYVSYKKVQDAVTLFDKGEGVDFETIIEHFNNKINEEDIQQMISEGVFILFKTNKVKVI